MSTAEAVPTGNTYDKYGSQNPVVRRLMAGFERSLDGWRLVVADDGCGLPETGAGRHGGLGMGLVKALARQAGGSLAIINEGGACFVIELPD